MSGDMGDVRGRRAILRFAFPSVVMMIFISSYSVVDGVFVSNFLGTDALAAINILMPAGAFFTALGFMFAAGGSAYVANLMGRGRKEDAERSLTRIITYGFLIAAAIAVLGLVFEKQFVALLGADDVLAPMSEEYWTYFVPFAPVVVLQYIFTQFLIVAGRPQYAFAVSVGGGLTNIFLDWLFMVPMGWGIAGAAIASVIGASVPTVFGTVFFLRSGNLGFRRGRPEGKVISKTCTNGMSEMASELSGAVTTFLFNIMMMRYVGPDGVAAITIMMYVMFLSLSAIIGYSNGVAPLMSYRHGSGEKGEMRELFSTSMLFSATVCLAVFAVMELFAKYVVGVFAGDSQDVGDLAVEGSRIFSFGFLFMGIGLYSSSLFTSLSNGPVSALIAFVRSLILLAPLIYILPTLFGIGAIWYAVPVTELFTAVLALFLIVRYGPEYGFLPSKG